MTASGEAREAAIAAWLRSDRSTSGLLDALHAAWRTDRPGEALPEGVRAEALRVWRSGSPDGVQMVLAVWAGLASAQRGLALV